MHHCGSSKEVSYDLRNQTYSGDIIRGPKTIVAKNLNILRYDYTANSKVSFSQPPDLWGKLTGIASPQSKQSQLTPTTNPKTTNPSAPGAPAPKPAGGKLAARAPTTPSQAARDAVDKANKAILQANMAVNTVNAAIAGINDQSLNTEIAKGFAAVQSKVSDANKATREVADAGEELLSFIRAAEPGTTYQGIAGELAVSPNESTFMGGVNAKWPSAEEIATLKVSTERWKSLVGNLKTAFDSARPSLAFDLSTAEQALSAAKGVLDQKLQELQAPADQSALADANHQVAIASLEIQTAQRALETTSIRVQSLTSDLGEMATALTGLDTTGDAYKSFQQAHAKLSGWQERMRVLKEAWDNYKSHEKEDPARYPDPFTMRIAGTCDYAFASTKQTAVKLTAVDELPDKSAAAPSDVLSVTIECASPFTVSAGVEFSTVPYNQFAIQPVATPSGSTATTNQFVYTTHSNFHPLPIAMVSARLCEPNEKISIHASFGLSGNFNSDSNGGSSAEFLFGPSIALFRTMFITPGLHIGRQASLADGFNVGNPAPPNVTTAPVQTSYKPGFGLAITFTKP
jgi:hypothetical protein